VITAAIFAAMLQAGPPPQRAATRSAPVRAPRVATTQTSKRAPKQRSVAALVVIDAGHGGVDPGAPIMTKGDLSEKDITLQVALKLGDALRLRGIDVAYTRTRDTLVALADRGRMANKADGDVFISIHVNAANRNWKNPSAARGFETYFLAEAKTDDARRVEEMENESMRFEPSPNRDSTDPLSFILRDMEQNQYLRESADFAATVQRRLGQVHPGPSRGVKQAGFHVLITALMPAILVEIGFGTNTPEAAYLSSSVRQQAIARSIADATAEYLERYQRRAGSSSSGTHD
jgi:N-acetylmuramoyl-L-alanine amidase